MGLSLGKSIDNGASMKVFIEDSLVKETSLLLQKFGKAGFEGLVLWLGAVNEAEAVVSKVITPPQTPIKSEHGVGYVVSGETLFALNRHLNESGLRLIAQVHSHPTHAYHSEADDRYAIVTREGFFSLVVLDFAFGPADISCWAIYRLMGGCWVEISSDERNRFFKVTYGGVTVQQNEKKKPWWQNIIKKNS